MTIVHAARKQSSLRFRGKFGETSSLPNATGKNFKTARRFAEISAKLDFMLSVAAHIRPGQLASEHAS
jgi:hypothetical protein